MASAERDTAKSGAADAADAAEAAPRPFVAVWDVRTLREVARVPLSADARAVAGVAFSPDGAMLVTAGCDNNHTVQVWDWRVARVGEPRRSRTRSRVSKTEDGTLRSNVRDRSNGRSNDRSEPFGAQKIVTAKASSASALVGLLHENTGFKERPGGVFGLEFDPFATRAARRRRRRAVRELRQETRQGVDAFGADERVGLAADVLRVSRRARRVLGGVPTAAEQKGNERGGTLAALVTGHPDGSLLVWRGGAAVQKIEGAHGRGARAIQPDGSVAWGGGVRAMRLRLGSGPGDHGAALVTGGADGALAQWAVVDGTLAGKITEPLVLAESPVISPDVAFSNASDAGVGRGRPRDRRRARHGPRRRGHVAVRAVGRGPAPRARDGERADAGAQGFPPRGVLAPLGPGPALHRVRLRRRARVGRGADGDDQAVRPGVRGDVPSPSAATRDTQDTQTHVAVGGEKGEVLVLTESSFEVVFAAKDARGAGAEDLKFSPDGGSRLAVTYRDGKVEVFRRNAADRKGPRYEKMARFKGHSASARHVDWSADGATLATCGADYEILHWDVPLARRFVEGASARSETRGAQNLSGQRDRRFATRTAVLGFPVMGVWPSASDGTDVNALDVSPCGRYAVTADDGGFVKLFAYPVLAESAPHRAYRGHAGHVAMVRFNCDGTRVVSAGGRDRAAFQFSLRRRPEPAPAPPPRARRWLPLDASGKAFGFREPREGEAEAEDEDAILARKETLDELDELDSDEILEDREADLPVFVPRREDVFAGSEPSGSEPASSLLEVDANALSASVSHRSQGEKTNGNGNETKTKTIRSEAGGVR
jgi:microtubule-associated protein-like 6